MTAVDRAVFVLSIVTCVVSASVERVDAQHQPDLREMPRGGGGPDLREMPRVTISERNRPERTVERTPETRPRAGENTPETQPTGKNKSSRQPRFGAHRGDGHRGDGRARLPWDMQQYAPAAHPTVVAYRQEAQQEVSKTVEKIKDMAKAVRRFVRGRRPVSPWKLLLRSSDLNQGEMEMIQKWHDAQEHQRLLETEQLSLRALEPGVLRHPDGPPRHNPHR